MIGYGKEDVLISYHRASTESVKDEDWSCQEHGKWTECLSSRILVVVGFFCVMLFLCMC